MRFPGVVVCMALATLVISAQEKPAPPTASRDPAGIVISEILFDPRPGDSAFVELLNTTKTAADLSRLAIRIGDAELSLIRVIDPLLPGARLLVRFDGQGRVEGLTLHAPAKVDLDRNSGRVELVNGVAETVDAVGWGDADGAADVDMGSALGAEPVPGRTIGRPPGMNEPLDLGQWVLYGPAEATPGRENLLPRVSTLLPSTGSVVKSPLTLHWYPIAGATSYRVQLATDQSFAKPLLDRTVTTTSVDAGPLTIGPYVWRVQSIDAAGKAATFSDISRFEVDNSMFVAAASVPKIALKIQQGPPTPFPPGTRTADRHFLGVPEIEQHKDTKMLQLENPNEHGKRAWDVDHGDYSSDPSDATNCVQASIAMVNHYYGGDLSEDRIGYEVRSKNAQRYVAAVSQSPRFRAGQAAQHLKEKHTAPPQTGPEWDLTYGDGLLGGQSAAAIAFAFTARGAAIDASRVGVIDSWNDAKTIWDRIQPEIENNRPLFDSIGNPSGNSRHMVVIYGWGTKNGRHYLYKLDPIQGPGLISLDTMTPSELANHLFFFLPQNPVARRQEVELRMDTDGDGVIDFDETERFHTDPHNMDTDGDGVRDKQDIASGVFDARYGYARHNTSPRGRDFDGDGKPTELDKDSDDGGCKDGIEDADGDGHLNGRELWNFQDTDDLCDDINGRILYSAEWQAKAGATKREMKMFRTESMNVTVKLKQERPGEMGPLVDSGSTYRFGYVVVLEIPVLDINGCHPIGRSSGRGNGRFDHSGAEIGGNYDQDTIVIGAGGDGVEYTHADLCVFAGSNKGESSSGLPSCEGKREITAGNAFVFDCTTPPAAPPNMGFDIVWFTYEMKGRVTVGGPVLQTLAAELFGRRRDTLSLRTDRRGGLRLEGR